MWKKNVLRGMLGTNTVNLKKCEYKFYLHNSEYIYFFHLINNKTMYKIKQCKIKMK